MANRLRGEISVNLNGKEYTLRPDFNAMCEFEDKTGASCIAIIRYAKDKGVPIKVAAAAIWAGIRSAEDVNPDVPDFQEVGQYIMKEGIAGFLEPVMKFVSSALMSDEENATAEAHLKKE